MHRCLVLREAPMHYSRPPHRPQAVHLRFASRRRLVQGGRPVTWPWCLAAVVLLAVAGAIGHSSAAAARLPQAPGRAGEGAAHAGEASRAAPENAGDALSEERAVALHGSRPSLRPPAGPSRRLVVQLTAYSASLEEGTAWGITRVGTRVRPGVVAVDPAVIPLGSRLRIEGLAGT